MRYYKLQLIGCIQQRYQLAARPRKLTKFPLCSIFLTNGLEIPKCRVDNLCKTLLECNRKSSEFGVELAELILWSTSLDVPSVSMWERVLASMFLSKILRRLPSSSPKLSSRSSSLDVDSEWLLEASASTEFHRWLDVVEMQLDYEHITDGELPLEELDGFSRQKRYRIMKQLRRRLG